MAISHLSDEIAARKVSSAENIRRQTSYYTTPVRDALPNDVENSLVALAGFTELQATVITADVHYMGVNRWGFGDDYMGDIRLAWPSTPNAISYNVSYTDPDFGPRSYSYTSNWAQVNSVWGPDGGPNGGFWGALARVMGTSAEEYVGLEVQPVFPDGPGTAISETVTVSKRPPCP